MHIIHFVHTYVYTPSHTQILEVQATIAEHEAKIHEMETQIHALDQEWAAKQAEQAVHMRQESANLRKQLSIMRTTRSFETVGLLLLRRFAIRQMLLQDMLDVEVA